MPSTPGAYLGAPVLSSIRLPPRYARRLGIELDFEPMKSASCTGAGILQEKNLRLGDTLNARTFALAERAGLP